MGELETELSVCRALYERRLRTFKRVKHHLSTLDRSSSDWASGDVALKIAEAELCSAKDQLEVVFNQIKAVKSGNPNVANIADAAQNRSMERDHFSDALNRIDPKDRLQLAK